MSPLVFRLFGDWSGHFSSTTVVFFVISEATICLKRRVLSWDLKSSSIALGKSLKLEFGAQPSLLSALMQPLPLGTQNSLGFSV